jgi:hypothetical protein
VIHLIIGAVAAAAFFLLVNFVRNSGRQLFWYHWFLTFLCLCYAVFVVEMIVGFVSESAFRAALVLGVIFGIPVLIWVVLLARFVFLKK